MMPMRLDILSVWSTCDIFPAVPQPMSTRATHEQVNHQQVIRARCVYSGREYRITITPMSVDIEAVANGGEK